MNRYLVLSLLTVAPAASAGTAVGHPVPVTAGVSATLTFDTAALPVSDVVFEPCSGGTSTETVDETLDPLDDDTITLIDGTWCGITIELDGPFTLTGSGSGGGTFSLTLDVDAIDLVLDGAVVVVDGVSDVERIELAFEDWVTASMLGLAPSVHVDVDATHSLHDTLHDRVAEQSTLE